MRRIEPPSMATWLLEHGMPGARDDALIGDLLEEFASGRRSTNWYWQQVLSACGVAWLACLRERVALLIFAAFWAMMAPAWKVFCDRIDYVQIFSQLWPKAGPLWIITAFAVWTLLHSTFLWAGIFIYILFTTNAANALRGESAIRAYLRAPLIFLPIIGTTFVLMYLYSFPGLINTRLAPTPLSQIIDLRLPADILRIPYFVALVWALWSIAPRRETRSVDLTNEPEIEEFFPEVPTVFSIGTDRRDIAGLLRFLVAAGLINALIAGYLLSRVPSSHAPSLTGLFIRALIYVAVGAAAGTSGAWLYWRRASRSGTVSPPFSFKLFALTCAAGWVWAPAVVLLVGEDSRAAAAVAAMGAALLAAGLRGTIPSNAESRALDLEERPLFADTLQTPASEASGYVIAACIYAGAYAIYDREAFTASTLLGIAAFLFAWKRVVARPRRLQEDVGQRRASMRLMQVAGPAVLVTLWALLMSASHGGGFGHLNTALAGDSTKAPAKSGRVHNPDNYAFAFDGYESIVLWPEPPKKQILAPVAPPPRDVRLTQPRVIRFTGSYWYFQPPSTRPGPHAHITHGNPLAVDIHSTSYIPLTMEAHQILSYPEHLTCCVAIQVEIENRDNRVGEFALGMVLTNTGAPGRPSLYLGQRPIVSSQPDHFAVKSSSVRETLHFPIPAHSALRRFDEITLVVIPEPMRFDMGARIAVEQFELEAR
jgi:hypothetical protein